MTLGYKGGLFGSKFEWVEGTGWGAVNERSLWNMVIYPTVPKSRKMKIMKRHSKLYETYKLPPTVPKWIRISTQLCTFVPNSKADMFIL